MKIYRSTILFSYLSEYVDDDIDPDKKKTETSVGDEKIYQLSTDFGIRRGQLQIALQKLYMTDSDQVTLSVAMPSEYTLDNDIADYSRLEGVNRSFRVFS